MARKAKSETPQGQIETLQQRRVKLRGERVQLEAELGAAKDLLATAESRLIDANRGDGTEAEGVQAEVDRAHVAVRDLSPKVAALRADEAEIGERVQEVEASEEGRAWLAARCLAGGDAANDAVKDLLTAVAAARGLFSEVQGSHSRLYSACGRAGVDKPPAVGFSDLGAVSSELNGFVDRTYPGKFRERFEEWLQQDAPEPAGGKMTTEQAERKFDAELPRDQRTAPIEIRGW